MSGRLVVLATVGIAVAVLAGVAILRPDRPRFGGERADEWGRRAASSDPAVADAARGRLRAGGREALPVLLWLARHEDPRIRLEGLRLVRDLGPAAREALPHLLGGLAREEADPEVRAATVDALGSIGVGSEAVVRALTRALDDESPAVRVAAARALARLGEAARPARDALRRRLEDAAEAVLPDGSSVRVGDAAREALRALE
jgi:HEAT repeat protein